MASNPMLQAVMLFQHHQTTTPFAPVPPVAARDVTKKSDRESEDEEEEEEREREEEEKKGEQDG